jgi:hypothetical protein
VDPEDENQLVEFRNKIWYGKNEPPECILTSCLRHVVEKANKKAPAFGRIFKEMIIVTSPRKPMLRAGKGTVRRAATLVIYEPEINHL